MWKVRDVMQTEVITVTPDMPVRELVQVLAQARISGAPVLGSSGRTLGVVSATDVMALAAYGADAHAADVWESEEGAYDEETSSYFRGADAPPEIDFATRLGVSEYIVEDIMTPAAFSVGPNDTIYELARFLLRGRIHRALVVENEKLIGIATTFDVLNAVASIDVELAGADLTLAGS